MKAPVSLLGMAAALITSAAVAAAAASDQPVAGGHYTTVGRGSGVTIDVGAQGRSAVVWWRIFGGGCTVRTAPSQPIDQGVNDNALPGGVKVVIAADGSFQGRRTQPSSWMSAKYTTFIQEARGRFVDGGKAAQISIRTKSYAKSTTGWTKCDGRWLKYKLPFKYKL